LNGDPETLITEYAENAEFEEVSYADLLVMTDLYGKQLDSVLQSLMSKKTIIQTEKEAKRYIHQQTYEQFKEIVVSQLKEFHAINQLKEGMPKGELPSKFPSTLSSKLFNMMLNMMAKANDVILSENTVRLPGHEVTLEADQSDLKKKILDIYIRAGLQPPYFKELIASFNVDPKISKNVLMLLVKEGTIVKIKDDLFFDAIAINRLKILLTEYLKSNGEINMPQFKEMTGISRKYTVPLLEYFDMENLTIRIGDIRKLRKQD